VLPPGLNVAAGQALQPGPPVPGRQMGTARGDGVGWGMALDQDQSAARGRVHQLLVLCFSALVSLKTTGLT
jgi:hypothetical protein